MKTLMELRCCCKCKKVKPENEFYFRDKERRLRNSWCKECAKKYTMDNRYRYQHNVRWNRLKNQYGISKGEFFYLLEQQHYKCAICGRKEKLFVDHDHNGKRVRGLLCLQCNSALGYAKDNIEILKKMIEYLSATQGTSDFTQIEEGKMRNKVIDRRMQGIMSEGNYLRPLSQKEYDFWKLHPLPFMWTILVEPTEALESTNHGHTNGEVTQDASDSMQIEEGIWIGLNK